MTNRVIQTYQAELDRNGYTCDAAQKAAIERLQKCCDEVIAQQPPKKGFLGKLLGGKKSTEIVKGVFMWGGVGRGKSFLMDAFYEAIPFPEKTRLHFHEFMRSIHQEMQANKAQNDPLMVVAANVANKYRVICFDEFHVSDIADAMILGRLLKYLYEHGVTFIMTSNYEPKDLYPGGLQRERFLPAIDLIYAHMDVVNVDTGVDYRMMTLTSVKHYFNPLGPETTAALENIFSRLTGDHTEDPILEVEGRPLQAVKCGHGVGWFTFHELCQLPRSQNDYLVLSERFHTIILSDVPQLGKDDFSPARRFTWLLDVLYDQKVQFVMSAACPVEELYTSGTMANEFERTVSRVTEMQSEEYTHRAKHNVKKL